MERDAEIWRALDEMWPAHAILRWLALNVLMRCTRADAVVDKERSGSIAEKKQEKGMETTTTPIIAHHGEI